MKSKRIIPIFRKRERWRWSKGAVVMFFFLFGVWGSGQAADFAQFQGNAAKTGALQESFSAFNDSTTVALNPKGSGSPIKAQNMVLIPLHSGELRAYDAFNLTLLWSKTLGGSKLVTPAYGSGVIAVATHSGKVYGLDESGNQKWFIDTTAQITGSITYANGKFYFGTGQPNYYLYEVDALTGAVTQQFYVNNIITGGVATDGTNLFFGAGDGKLRAISLAGFGLVFSVATTGTLYRVTPSVAGDVLYFAASDFDRNLYAVDAATGAQKWKTDLIPSVTNIKASSVAVSSTRVYLQAGAPNQNAQLIALDRGTGAIQWQVALGNTGNDNDLSTPLLVSDNPDILAVASGDGNLRIVDSSGNVVSTKPFSGDPSSGLAAASGVLYNLSETQLYTYRDNDTTNPTAAISSPTANQSVGASFTVTGTATDNHFVSYTLAYGAGANPTSYTTIATSYQEVAGGTLALWDTSSLAEGTYTLKLSVTDIAGNIAIATVAVVIDHTAPSLTVSSPADGLVTNQSNVTVSGSTAAGATVTVNGTNVTVQTDGSFQTTVTLSSGANTITVVASDAIGNSTTITRTVTLDTQAPSLTVSSPASDSATNSATLAVTGTVDVGSTLTINGTAQTYDSNGAFSKTLTLTEGANAITVEATDTAGNKTTVTRTVTLDTKAPSLTLTSPADKTTTSTASISVSGSTEVGATVTVQGQAITVDRQGAFSTSVTLSNGSNTITVVATDSVGNATTIAVTVTLDTSNPLLQITSPSNPALVNNASLTIQGKAEAGATVTKDGSAITVNNDGTFSVTVTLKEGDQTYLFEATDSAGNKAQVSLKVTLDSISPLLQITSPASSYLTNNPSLTIDGKTEVGATVTKDGSALTVQSDGTFSVQVSLKEGSQTFNFEATDSAGNKAQAALTVTLDTVPPQITLTSPSDGSWTNLASVTVEGSTETDAVVTLNGTAVTLTSGKFSSAATLAAEGANTITIEATDLAGNKTTKTLTVNLDTTPPELASLSSDSLTGMVADTAVQIKGTASDSGSGLAMLYLSEDSAFKNAVTSTLSAGSFDVAFTLSDGDGQKTIYAKVSDKAGNTSSVSQLTLLLDTKSYLQAELDEAKDKQEFETGDGTKVSLGKFSVKGKKKGQKVFIVVQNPLLKGKALLPPEDPDLKATNVIREITILDEGGNALSIDLLDRAALVFPYEGEDVASESGLRIFYYNGTDYEIVESIQSVDQDTKTVTAQTDHFSTFRLLSVVPQQNDLIAQSYIYPNPFHPGGTPTMSYRLKQDATDVKISFYSMQGQKFNEFYLFQGQQGTFIGRNKMRLSPADVALPNGVYFYVVEAHAVDGAKSRSVGKMVVLR